MVLMNNPVALEVKNIKKYFGGVKAVDDISLKLLFYYIYININKNN